MRERDAAVQAELARGFAALTTAPDPPVRDALLRKLGELRYVRRFLEEVGEIEDLIG